MTTIDPATLSTLSSDDFAKAVGAMTDKEVLAMMTGPDREVVLSEVFRRFPERYVPARIGEATEVVQIWVTGGPNGKDAYEITATPQACTVRKDPTSDDAFNASLLMGPVELAKLTTGRANPIFLVMRGKIKLRGDLAIAARFSSYFDLPSA